MKSAAVVALANIEVPNIKTVIIGPAFTLDDFKKTLKARGMPNTDSLRFCRPSGPWLNNETPCPSLKNCGKNDSPQRARPCQSDSAARLRRFRAADSAVICALRRA